MESLQFGSEISDVQEDLVKINLRIRALVESFSSVDSSHAMEKLNCEIRAQFDLMRKSISGLRDLAKKQQNPQSFAMLKADADSHEDQMSACHTAFKKANLACISKINARGRDKLFSGKPELNSAQADKESVVRDSGKATEQLKAISRHLAATVERSSKTMEELTESSKTMNDAGEEFKSMGSVIGQSRKLITKYGRREVTDRVLILFAAAFFFAVVFYILRKRVLGPLDPFSLIWASITAFIRSVINLLAPDEDEATLDPVSTEPTNGGQIHAEL